MKKYLACMLAVLMIVSAMLVPSIGATANETNKPIGKLEAVTPFIYRENNGSENIYVDYKLSVKDVNNGHVIANRLIYNPDEVEYIETVGYADKITASSFSYMTGPADESGSAEYIQVMAIAKRQDPFNAGKGSYEYVATVRFRLLSNSMNGVTVTADKLFVKDANYTNYRGTFETATATVPVGPHATGVKINASALTSMKKGATGTFTATVLPENAVNKQVTWISSNPKIITVNPETGEYKAVGAGTAVVTATTVDGGFAATAAVKVTN